ncbi:MAG: ribosome recycling factor, partial [Acidobacteriota bacterium]
MIEGLFRDTHAHMTTSLEVVTRELNGLRTGRASISILDEVVVDYYGVPTPLNQLAGLSAPEPTLILVQPYDKSAIKDIEKAILQSDLGLNPNNDGTVIRIPIPELTEERRQELTKVVSRLAEQGKTAIRNLRRDANERVKKLQTNKEISEDEEHRAH